MLDRISHLSQATLASLFYHPDIDFEYIILQNYTSGYPISNYLENSPLHQIVKALYDKRCSFAKITDLCSNNGRNIFIKLSRLFRYFISRIKVMK
ncbi:hypothetical protein B0I53_002398 [Clostridium saccharobutylicum]|nr:hypothetical protein [Clostridium saccharobutylicum]